MSWFDFLYFNLPLLTERAYVISNFSWNFRGSAKEVMILLLSWSTLYITFSKCKVSWFLLFYFDLPLFTKSVCIKSMFYCGLFLRVLVQYLLLKFHILYSFILEISLAPSRNDGTFKILWNIEDGAFAKLVNGLKPLDISPNRYLSGFWMCCWEYF